MCLLLRINIIPMLFPSRQKVVEGNDQWSTSAATYVSNGPFKLTDYKIKDQVVLERMILIMEKIQ